MLKHIFHNQIKQIDLCLDILKLTFDDKYHINTEFNIKRIFLNQINQKSHYLSYYKIDNYNHDHIAEMNHLAADINQLMKILNHHFHLNTNIDESTYMVKNLYVYRVDKPYIKGITVKDLIKALNQCLK